MATLTGGTAAPLRFSDHRGRDFLSYDESTRSPTELRFYNDDDNYTVAVGTGMAFNMFGLPTGGTVSSLKTIVGGKTFVDVQGLDVPLVDAFNAAIGNGLLEFLLEGADTITGTSFSDELWGGGGNDVISAGAGRYDLAAYSGSRRDYTITKNLDGSVTVTDKRVSDIPDHSGIDTLTGVEFLRFGTQVYSVAGKHIVKPYPIVPKAQTFSVAENESTSGLLDAVDLKGGALTFKLASKAPAGLTLASDGSFTLVADGAPYEWLRADQTMQVAFKVQASAGGRKSAAETVTVTVTGKNDAFVAKDDLATLTTTRSLAIGVLRNDTDLDRGDTKTLVSATEATWGVTSLSGANVRYALEGKVVKVGRGESLTDSFSYVATDKLGLSDSGDVTVVLKGRALSGNATTAMSLTADKADIVTVDVAALANVSFGVGGKLKAVSTVKGFGEKDSLVLINSEDSFRFTSASEYENLTLLKDVAQKAASLLQTGEATIFEFGGSSYLYVERDDGELFNKGDGLVRFVGLDADLLQRSEGTNYLKFALAAAAADSPL